MVRGRDKFNKYKSIIFLLVKIDSYLPKKINYILLSLFRNINGNIGLLIRYILIKNLSRNCGHNVSIHPGCYLFNLETIDFGDNISIHPMCYINGSGGLTIGNNVSIAHGVTIMTESHNFESLEVPIKDQGLSYKPVTINDDVWIGSKVMIMYGVTINTGSVIGASSVVSKSVSSFSVYIGNPAKKLRSR